MENFLENHRNTHTQTPYTHSHVRSLVDLVVILAKESLQKRATRELHSGTAGVLFGSFVSKGTCESRLRL